MNGNDILIQLMDKFKLRTPIPDAVRQAAVKNQAAVLKNVFRATGEYSLYSGAGISVYYTVKKFGFKISFTTAKIITILFPLFFASIVIIASLTGFKSSGNHDAAPSGKIIQDDPVIDPKKDKAYTEKNTISIPLFKFDEDEQNSYIAKFATYYVSDGLLGSVRGFKIIDPRTSKIFPSVSRYRIAGSVGKLGQITVINVKVVEGETGHVLYMCEEEIYSLDDLETAGKKIADKISLYFSGNSL